MACVCFPQLTARYKFLVNSVFPVNAEEGLVKKNIDKLVFYAATSPEKLDRISEYLGYRVWKDLYRFYPRYDFVIIGMDVMDKLLGACSAQHLDLYLDSYLKTIQLLLESPEPKMLIRGTESFVKFSKKEEIVPAYHRTYSFFTEKFSEMCHYEASDNEVTDRIRESGLRGIAGVIRKIESEDLAENIWSACHMEMIIPSLMINIKTDKVAEDHCPQQIAENTMRDLISRTGFKSIKSPMGPVLSHMDNHELWEDRDLSKYLVQMIIFSAPQKINHVIIEMFLSHLNKHVENINVLHGITFVLQHIFKHCISDQDVGHSILEIVNLLLSHLHSTVKNETDDKMKEYQDALIDALGEYATHLPNFQLSEVMMFILGKMSSSHSTTYILLRALLTVSEQFTNIQFSTSLPVIFLEPLLEQLEIESIENQVIFLEIIQTLIDKNKNRNMFKVASIEPNPVFYRPSRNIQDTVFMSKHGRKIYQTIFKVLEQGKYNICYLNNLYTTCALFLFESHTDDNIWMQVDMIEDIQDLAFLELDPHLKFQLHSMCLALLVLITSVNIPALTEYKDSIIYRLWNDGAPVPLLPLQEDYVLEEVKVKSEEMMINLDSIRTILEEGGHAPIQRSSPRPSPPLLGRRMSKRMSYISVASTEFSPLPSPLVTKDCRGKLVSFEELKDALTTLPEKAQVAKEEEEKLVKEMFKTASFKELCDMTMKTKQSKNLYNCLDDIFKITRADKLNVDVYERPIYEEYFPEMFLLP